MQTEFLIQIKDLKASIDNKEILKGLTLSLNAGEIHAIMGPNGAGKSTLLKILSRVTDPTEGYGELRGRVGSLLEVGTGFHPELTGDPSMHRYFIEHVVGA